MPRSPRYAGISRSSAGSHVGVGQRAVVRAAWPASSTSRRSDAIARRCAASCSRSLTPRRSSPADPSRLEPAPGSRSPPPARARAARRRAPRRARRRCASSARPRLPSASAATARASVSSSPAPSAPRDIVGASGRKRSRGQRERTVGSSTSGRDGHEDEDRRGRRLFERLQQRVLRRAARARRPRR